MLEWYRAAPGYGMLMADCEALLRRTQRAAGTAVLTWQGATADANQPFERLSVADAFKRHCGIHLLATAPDPGRPDAARLAAAAESVGIAPHPGDDWEALFFRIFLDRIEPHLGISAPTLLYDYPVSLAALSRPKPGDPRLCERFELYVCGLELANAFGELTDAQEQRRRFLADQAKKQTLFSDTRSPPAWLKVDTESCPLEVVPLSHKVSLPPAKPIRADPLPEAPWIVSCAPPQIVELPLPATIDSLPEVASKKVLAAPPVIVSPETPAIVSLPPLPPWIVSPAPPQIVSLPPLPPTID